MSHRLVHAVLASTVLVCIAAAPAAAQVDVGLKGGFNFSRFTLDPEDPDLTFPYFYGPTGGVFVTAGEGPVAIQVEGLYSRRGSKIEDELGAESLVTLDYIDVPLLLRFNGASVDATTLFVTVGPTIGFNFRARREDSDGTTSNLDDDIEQIEYGVSAGLGVQVEGLVIEGRYTHGLSNIDATASVEEDREVRHRTFTLLLGFAF
jgi:hypothetical protein